MTDENALKRNRELANLSVTSYVTGPLQKSVSRSCLQLIVTSNESHLHQSLGLLKSPAAISRPSFSAALTASNLFQTGQSLCALERKEQATIRLSDYLE
jgi:hypothetical protein